MRNLKKEDIENLSYKDITYLILENEKKGMNTLDLFNKIINILELPADTINSKIADYYTSLTTDKRFLLVDGLWDLRNRHTSDKVLSQVSDDEEDEEEIVDDQEEDIDNQDELYDEDIDDDSYDDDTDDLGDLVVLDEDEIDIDNN